MPAQEMHPPSQRCEPHLVDAGNVLEGHRGVLGLHMGSEERAGWEGWVSGSSAMQGRHGTACRAACLHMAWHGAAWHGMGVAWGDTHGMAWHDAAWRRMLRWYMDWAWHVTALDEELMLRAWYGMARPEQQHEALRQPDTGYRRDTGHRIV